MPLSKWIFIDVEACGPCPVIGTMTEFGAVDFETNQTFHGVLFESEPDPSNPAQSIITGKAFEPFPVFNRFAQWMENLGPGRPVAVSDNIAYDFQWINYGFHSTLGYNPFGHSGRRISDFYAGLVGDFRKTQDWKRLRVTPHDHMPVHDAQGNLEAFRRILAGER